MRLLSRLEDERKSGAIWYKISRQSPKASFPTKTTGCSKMNRLLTLLLSLCAAAAVANETITVYQLTGAIQCVDGTGIPPEEAADLLRGQGVTVISAERRKVPQDVADSCGAPSGEANVMKIAAADWSAFLAKNPDAGGYGLWVFDDSKIQIFKYDGTLQCGMGGEIPLDEMAKELESADIEIIASRKGTDGLVHISVCGASTGAINVYVIDRGALPAAQRLGYRLLVTRELTRQIKPAVDKKRQVGIAAHSLPLAPSKAPDLGPVPLLW
jgi:hypothetical protein